MIDFLDKEQLRQEEQSKQSNESFNEMIEMLFGKPSNNKVVARWKFNDIISTTIWKDSEESFHYDSTVFHQI